MYLHFIQLNYKRSVSTECKVNVIELLHVDCAQSQYWISEISIDAFLYSCRSGLARPSARSCKYHHRRRFVGNTTQRSIFVMRIPNIIILHQMQHSENYSCQMWLKQKVMMLNIKCDPIYIIYIYIDFFLLFLLIVCVIYTCI